MAEKKTDQRQALPMELDVKIYGLREDGSTLARRRKLRFLGSALRTNPKSLRCSSSSRQTRCAGLSRGPRCRCGGTSSHQVLRLTSALRLLARLSDWCSSSQRQTLRWFAVGVLLRQNEGRGRSYGPSGPRGECRVTISGNSLPGNLMRLRGPRKIADFGGCEVCYPCTKEFHKQLSQAVLNAYWRALEQSAQQEQKTSEPSMAPEMRM